jgi:hypothetical protein
MNTFSGPRRPLRPTTPTNPVQPAAAPVEKVVEKPAPVLEKTVQAASLTSLMALFSYVDSRPRLADETLKLVNTIRAELGREPRRLEIGTVSETKAPAAPVAPRPIGRPVTKTVQPEPAIVEGPDSSEDEKEEEDLTIGVGNRVEPKANDGFREYDPFALPGAPDSYEVVYGPDVPGRGIDPNDKWLKPFDRTPEQIDAERVAGEANQKRLEAEHERLAVVGRMRKRPPMAGGR